MLNLPTMHPHAQSIARRVPLAQPMAMARVLESAIESTRIAAPSAPMLTRYRLILML